jgi:hypothetical protein
MSKSEKKTYTKRVPTSEQVAKWRRVQLVDEYLYALSHGRYHAKESLYFIEHGGAHKAPPFLRTAIAEIERLAVIVREMNRRLPRVGSGPVPNSYKNPIPQTISREEE